MRGWRIILVAGFCVLVLLGFFLFAGLDSIISGGKRLIPSDKIGRDIKVTLVYDTGSRGAPTFIVHAKNVSGHTLGIIHFARYHTSDGHDIGERGEGYFLICLGQPGTAAPLNRYTTHAINDRLASPIKAGEEQTFEYQMKPGDIERIGSNEVTACVSYYDFDPMQRPDPNQPPPPLLAAWSAPMKVEPLQWGIVDNGLQVGLEIENGVATVQARNVSERPLQLEPPEDEDSSSRNAFYLLEVLPYSGMYRALHPEKIPTRRYRHELLPLAPGQVISATYKLTSDDLQILKGAQLRAHCIQLISPIRHEGRASDSNAVAVSDSWWP